MSFSASVKNELCRLETNDHCCLLCELSAVIRLSGISSMPGSDSRVIKIVTENAAFARRLYSNIRRLYKICPEIVIRRNRKLKKHILYVIAVTRTEDVQRILTDDVNLDKTCCKKAYLRGLFLAGGSVSDPEKTYHLEINVHSLEHAEQIKTLTEFFDLHGKVVKRKDCYVVYLKEGENIVDFLNIIGAHLALMELENVRILKDMRNNVNRIVNCETANLEKTVNASVRQVENIRYIIDNFGFSKIPENLREIAVMRLDYSEANLKELGEMLSPPLGKSGVNHRLRKLDEIAENLRGKR